MDPDGPLPPFITPDHLLSAVVDGSEFVDAKMRAMKAHATQIEVDGPFFALSNNIGNEVWGQRVLPAGQGRPGPDQRGRSRDGPVRGPVRHAAALLRSVVSSRVAAVAVHRMAAPASRSALAARVAGVAGHRLAPAPSAVPDACAATYCPGLGASSSASSLAGRPEGDCAVGRRPCRATR